MLAVDTEDGAARLPRAVWGAVLALCVAGAVVTVGLAGRPEFPLDDPYITIHNIRALRDGHDPNFPGLSALYGATSAVHLLLGAALSTFMQPRWALYVVAWIAAGLYAAGLLATARAFQLRRPATACVLALGLLSGRTPLVLMNGLETGLGLAAAIWLIAFAVRSDRRARILAPLLAGLAPFIRPELAALAAVLSALRWRDLIREARVAGSQRPSNMIVRDAAMIVAAAAPWMIWYTVATGLPFPTTASVKAVWFAESCTGLGQHVHLFRLALGQFLAVAGPVSLAVFVLAFHPVGRACLVFVVAMLASYFVELPGGLTHNEGRYAHLLIPMFAAGVAIMLVPGAPTKLRNPSRVVLLFSVLFTCAMVPLQIRSFATNRLQNREYNETARFLLRSLPPDARILAHDVGYISAATPFRIIDLVGLKWPESARAHRAVTLPSCGRSRGDVIDAIARREHATHLVALRQWDELFGISAALVRHGWTMRVLRSRQDGYDVYALTPP